MWPGPFRGRWTSRQAGGNKTAARAQPRAPRWRGVSVSSSQHTDLLRAFARDLGVRIDHDLALMRPGQAPADVLARVPSGLGPVLAAERPDLVLVQGDTTAALAGALAASHFAATDRNVEALRAEGVAAERITLTGNPVVDALRWILDRSKPSLLLAPLLDSLAGQRVIALTTHRRENFGDVMAGHLRALRRFVDRHPELALVFPVHPNPAVRSLAQAELGDHDRIHCIEPLDYADFLHLLSRAWLVAADSGGVQEEAPSLGKPVLVLRDTTERVSIIGRWRLRAGA